LGVPAATGLALGLVLRGGTGRVAVISGDGELQTRIALEGYQWAVRAELHNVLFIVRKRLLVRRNHPRRTPRPTGARIDGFRTRRRRWARRREHGRRDRTTAAQYGGPGRAGFHIRGNGVVAIEEKSIPMSWIPDDDALDAVERALDSAPRTAEDVLGLPFPRHQAGRTVSGRGT
jgi:transketolase